MELMPLGSPRACLPANKLGEVLDRAWTIDYRGDTDDRACSTRDTPCGMVMGGYGYCDEAIALETAYWLWLKGPSNLKGEGLERVISDSVQQGCYGTVPGIYIYIDRASYLTLLRLSIC
jgi:hypothetical protein